MTPWTVARQAPLSMEFSRQEYWSGLPFPSPGDLPDPGIEPRSPALQVDSLPTELPGKCPAGYQNTDPHTVLSWDGLASDVVGVQTRKRSEWVDLGSLLKEQVIG